MKRIKNKFGIIIDFITINSSWNDVEKVKQFDSDISEFKQNLPVNLFYLKKKVDNDNWKPSPKKPFIKHEKKTRIITPIGVEGKIISQAIYKTISKDLFKRFIFESHACVSGHGQHMSALRVQRYLFNLKSDKFYAFKGDVHHYFQSINHRVLKKILRKYFIKDKRLLKLFYSFINSFPKGIPIGWLTSEMLANIYLSPLDKKIKKEFPNLFYSRFMDDFVVIGTDLNQVNECRKMIEKYMNEVLKLKINKKSTIYKNHVDYCGYIIYKQYMLPRAKVVRCIFRRLRKYIKYGQFTKLIQSMNSFFGYIRFSMCKTIVAKMIYKLFNNILFIENTNIYEYYYKVLNILKIKDQLTDLGRKNTISIVTKENRKNIKKRINSKMEDKCGK